MSEVQFLPTSAYDEFSYWAFLKNSCWSLKMLLETTPLKISLGPTQFAIS